MTNERAQSPDSAAGKTAFRALAGRHAPKSTCQHELPDPPKAPQCGTTAGSWCFATGGKIFMVHDNDAKGSRATKDTLFGDEVYVADAMPVKARGIGISPERLEELRTERLHDILTDRQGRDEVDVLFGSLELTAFGAAAVAKILKPPPEEEHSRGWREGEALAEAWLIDAEDCEFPWPFNRDLRHPRASLPGPELIGFTRDNSADRFAFAQVKTSKEHRFPPSVVRQSKHGLVAQLTALHDDRLLKDCVVKYVGYRAKSDQPWCGRYRTAALRYFNSDAKAVSLFGVLVRDVPPAVLDLADAAIDIANACCVETRVALYGLYLPADAIPAGPQHASRGKRKGGAHDPPSGRSDQTGRTLGGRCDPSG